MYRNQRIGRVSLLRGVTGNNVEHVLGSISVAAVRIIPSSEIAVSEANTLWALVAIAPVILTDSLWLITGISHILEGVMQKGVLRLAVLSIIVDTTHCHVALERAWLYVLNFKPLSLGEIRRHSINWIDWSPKSQQQQEGSKASQEI